MNGKRLFDSLKAGECRTLKRSRRLWGHWVYITALRLPDQELMIIATQKAVPNAISDYARRWEIETLFGILKSRGFNLEDAHLKDPERLSQLLALLTLGMCWALQTGEWLAQQKAIVIKTHGRKAKSVFRVGCDYIRDAVLNIQQATQQLLQAIHFLSCT